jgi:hypothetical protein
VRLCPSQPAVDMLHVRVNAAILAVYPGLFA